MKYFDALMNAGFVIKWRTLLVGWDGPGKYGPLLDVADVRDFAVARLAAGEDDPRVVDLAAASDDDRSEVEKTLRILAARDVGMPATELRKWRVILLEGVMAELARGPLHGMLALTEFWERFDYPLDSPHRVQGRDDTLSPGQYYSAAHFENAMRKHGEWIEREKGDLAELDRRS